ncbi:hypothetical protein SLS58_003183 [Diplodia intermedia]|uniref:BTB domain-containing protein n=1 Tax=Diplodia intermedia TaxID=856260 RepID=A0ABR3TX45_9PEZI
MASRALGLPAFSGSDQFSDITLKFSGCEFKAHKVILAAKSGWFRGAFESAFKEGSADEIELHDDDPEALEIALRFLYGYRIRVPADEQATFEVNVAWYLILYEVSNKYDIPSLADATARIVHDHFGRGNHLLAREIIAHSLYHELSHDGHGFKKRYIRAMREVLPQFDEGMKQFTRDNPEFAGEHKIVSTYSSD